jgi:CHAD domain-containing protein
MNGDKLFDRWRRRYQDLLKRQRVLLARSRRRGDAKSVHELRVTVRRLRLMVRLAIPFVGREVADRYRAWSRTVSDATSGMRDLDVVLEWLTPRPDAAWIVERIAAQRRRLFLRKQAGLRSIPGGLCGHLRAFHTDAKARKRFARRYDNRFARLLHRIRPQARRYARMAVEERHAFRRQLRQLRYLRELALARRRQARDPVLGLLVRPQVAMGELQNLQLAEAVLRKQPPMKVPSGLLPDLAVAQARQDREIRLGLKALAVETPRLA